jgi:hypothetical protein
MQPSSRHFSPKQVSGTQGKDGQKFIKALQAHKVHPPIRTGSKGTIRDDLGRIQGEAYRAHAGEAIRMNVLRSDVLEMRMHVCCHAIVKNKSDDDAKNYFLA